MEVRKPEPAQLARDTTRENPWPLSRLSENMRKYVDRVDPTWVEAQIIEYNQRPGNRMSFFVAKDLEADMSMQVKAFGGVVAAAGSALSAGARVVMRVKPDFYLKTGALALMASEIHAAGLGGFLEQLEQLKQKLAAEGILPGNTSNLCRSSRDGSGLSAGMPPEHRPMWLKTRRGVGPWYSSRFARLRCKGNAALRRSVRPSLSLTPSRGLT